MGYKLAGFNVIGFNEIDKTMAQNYKANLDTKYGFICSIKKLIQKKLPKELYHLDVLDGSPPCSSFSHLGQREKSWGMAKKFREGQQKQILDTLFLDFIKLTEKLKPKIIVAENVMGIRSGNAVKFFQKIINEFNKIGYVVTVQNLNAADFGVPQNRRRVFFFGIKKEYLNKIKTKGLLKYEPYLNLNLNLKKIPFKKFAKYNGPKITQINQQAWNCRKIGDRTILHSKKRAGIKATNYSLTYVYENKPLPTIVTRRNICFSKPVLLSNEELCIGGTFPLDYNFCTMPVYIIGMSVPPVMMAYISNEINKQWLRKL